MFVKLSSYSQLLQDLADDDDSFFFDPSQPSKEKAVSTSDKENKHSTEPDTVRFEDSKVEGYNSDVSTDIEDEGVPTQVFDDQPDSKNQDASDASANLSKNKENTFKGIDENVPVSGVECSSKDVDIKITDDDERGWNSDGSTDIEEDIFNRATQVFSNQDKSPKLSGNIDAVNNMSPAVKNYDNTQEIMEAFNDNDDEAMLPTQTFVANESPSNKKVQEVDDDIPTQLFLDNEDEAVFKKPFATAPKNKKKFTDLSNTSRGFDDDIPDDFLDETANADILDTPTQPYSSDDQHQPSSTCNDSLLNAPTLPFDDYVSPYKFQLPCKSVQKEKYSVSKAADDEVDDLFNLPTQPFSSNNDATTLDEDIPTQYFEPTPKNESPKKEDKYSEKEESDIEVDIYNQPTQIFSAPKDNDLDRNTPAQLFDVASVAKSENIGSRENTCRKVDVTSHIFLSPAHIKGQAEVDSNDDDLPPTQIFSAPKDNADVDCNAPTQLFDGDSVIHSENRGTKEGTSKVKVTSSQVVPVAHIKGQTEVDVNDDDLPLTQIFTAHSTSKQAPDPATMEDILSPTQPFLNKANQEIKDVLSDNALKVSGKCLADEKNDSEASTLVLRDTSMSESEDDYCAPTQPFNDDGNNNKSDTPQPLSNESKKESNKSLLGIAEAWDELDADATQDISIDAVVGIDEARSCTTIPLLGAEQKDGTEDSSLNDSASDSSETLLNDRQLGDDGEVMLSDLKIDGNHSASASENKNLPNGTDSEKNEPVQDEGKEKGMKSLEMDYLDAEKKEKIKECTYGVAEKESYNSDESTDVEDDMISLQNDMIHVTGNTSAITKGNEISHVELSSDPDILRNKVYTSLSCKESPQMSSKQQNDEASPASPPKVIQETLVKEAESNKKSFQFKFVSKVVPVVSSPDPRVSTPSPFTQDSCVSVDFTLSSSNSPGSEESNSQEAMSGNMQAPEKEGKVSEHHRDHIDSGSDSEDNAFNFSQKLFDLPPDEDVSIGNTLENEKMDRTENKVLDGLEVDEKVKGKDTKTAKEVKQKDMVMAEGKPEVQKGTMKTNEKDVAHKNKGNVPGDEETSSAIVENGNTSDSISGNDSSILITRKTKKGLKLNPDMPSHLTYNNETDSSPVSEKNSRRIELTDYSGSKSEENCSFSGFDKSSEEEESDNIDRHKEEVNIEKSESGSETVRDSVEERAKEEGDTSKTKELKVLETTSASVLSDGNVEEEQQVDDGLNVTKSSETHKPSLSVCLREKKSKDEVRVMPAEENKVEESVLSARDKRKRNESMKMKDVEHSKTKRRTRTKIVESDSEPSSRNSSTSRDTLDGVTLEDIPNIRRSGRRRNNSGASTHSSLSYLSSSSSQSAATAIDEESGFSGRSKWKRDEKIDMKIEEQTTVSWRKRTRYKDSDTEPSSRNSSSSRDSLGDQTLDDVQNICRSSRRRKSSGTSTHSNLSHLSSGNSSSQSESRSASAASSVSTSSTIKRGRKSKMTFAGRIDVPPQETEEIDDIIIESNLEKNRVESDISINTSRKRTSQNSSRSDSHFVDNEKNKTITRRTCRKMESAEKAINEKKMEIITPKTEISTVPKEVEDLTCGRASRRARKEPKRFSPDKDHEAGALKGSSGRIRGRSRKSDVSQIIPESSEKLPARRARRSAMPNLFVSTSVTNDEEVEIVLAQEKSNQKLDEHENKKEMAQIPKRGRRSAAAKAKAVKENESLLSAQEADVQLNATKQPAEQNSRKSRSSVARSQKDPAGPKKPRLNTIPEKNKEKDSKDTTEADRRIQKRAQRSIKATEEQDANGSKSKVDDQLQALEKRHSRRGRLPNMESSDDSAVEETQSSRSSSQSSEDSHVCQRSKRKRGSDNSMDELLSTPKSSRSGRSRMVSSLLLYITV